MMKMKKVTCIVSVADIVRRHGCVDLTLRTRIQGSAQSYEHVYYVSDVPEDLQVGDEFPVDLVPVVEF